MSKNLPKSKTSYQNYLSLNNNCKVVSNGPKPLPHLNPENILTDNIRQVWLSNQLPAVCIIDMRNATQKPVYFNRIGFHCWHQYESNPKLIEIQYTGQDNPQNAVWVVLTKIRLELMSGWQHFKIPIIQTKNISFLKLNIMQNNSEAHSSDEDGEQNHQSNTYLNQVSLGYVEDIIQSRVELTAVNTNSREKTFSDFRKMPSSQKQVKKLSQKIKGLSTDNETMRRTIDHQNSIIMKLQQAMETLAQNVTQLQKIQVMQQSKIRDLQKGHSHPTKTQQSRQKQKLHQLLNDDSQILPSHSHEQKNQSRQKDKILLSRQKQKTQSRHHSVYQEHSSQLSKHNSVYKNTKGQSNQKSNNSKKRQVINVNVDQSEDSISEYEGVDERAYHYGRSGGSRGEGKEKAYVPMLQKLQELILLREEKKNRLKTQKKGRRQENVVISSDSDEESDT